MNQTKKKRSGVYETYHHNINSIYVKCHNDCKYCISENTDILMYDLSEKKIKYTIIGDKIIGIKWNEKGRPIITESLITNNYLTERKGYEVSLNDGTKLICSGDHRWLTNRGWKYTIGGKRGNNHRPYLTTKIRIEKIRDKNHTNLEETREYKKGYLSGMFKGDAHLKRHYIKGVKGEWLRHRQFRLALIDDEPLLRCKRYLEDFGVKTSWFKFNKNMNGIRTTKNLNFARIEQIIIPQKNKEFLRGWVSGFFDAEGSFDGITLRISNTNKRYLDILKYGLRSFGFNFIEEYDRKVKVIRIVGNRLEKIRFIQFFNIAITRKRAKIIGRMVNHSSKIMDIKPLNKKFRMVDIETTTGNFIANGCISHNCYMKPIIRRFPKNFQPGFFVKRLEAKRNMKNKTFFICSNCDIFDRKVPDKWIWDTIRYIDKHYDDSNTICMLTKNPKRYLDFIDYIPKDWLLGLTLETNYDELIRMYSKAPLPHERYNSMQKVMETHKNIYVMVEPIMDFDNSFFYNLLISLDAKYYLFGANSLKSIKLKEPNSDKLRTLINKLKIQGKIVIVKENTERLGIKSRIGYLKKNISDFKFETEEKPRSTTLEKYMEI